MVQIRRISSGLRAFTGLAALVSALAISGCTGDRPPASLTRLETALPAEPTTIVEGTTAVSVAVGTSQALFVSSPVVVLAGEQDEAAQPGAAAKAIELGVPLLLAPAASSDPPAVGTPAGGTPAGGTPAGGTPATAASDGLSVAGEIARLQAGTVLTFGEAAAEWARGDGDAALDAAIVPVAPGSAGDTPALTRPRPLDDLLVLALEAPYAQAAIATARASGARVLLLGDPDPRTSDEAIAALASQPTSRVLALGSAFAPAPQLRQRINTAATGVRLPGGGQVVFPGRIMVALYGHPGTAALGVLGEQTLPEAIDRVKHVAASYQSLVGEPVVPTFEIIATIAAAEAGPDGDYSNESSVELLRPWVEAAGKAGVYVVLDLQPGRTDFLTQAKLYTELLKQPHVGLALDPEWRLKPDQVHLEQIGSVSAAEINATAAWLADLTRSNNLPQKVLMLHQFRHDMITDRSTLDTDYDELRVVIHVDGFGTPGAKLGTWNALMHGAPDGVLWGWKNFYDEDSPTFSPAETIAVEPSPVFISYQ